MAALRGLDANANSCLLVLGYHNPGDGGGGPFHWDAANNAPDDGGTVIVPATNPPTGRWRRLSSGPVDVRWFGAKGDNVHDDTFAFQAAIASLAHGAGGTVMVAPPPVAYRLTATLCWNDKPVTLLGGGSGSQPSAGCRLNFGPGVTGIVMQNGPEGLGATGSLINLHIMGSATGPGSDDGVRVQCNSWRVINCTIEGFGGAGLRVRSGTDPDRTINANNGYAERVRCSANRGHGFLVEGADSNSCVFNGCDASANGGWGFFDNGFLGNTYIAPHVAGNGAGGYRVGNIGRNNRFIAAYAEEDTTIGFQTDPGGAGGNIFDNAQGSNAYNLAPGLRDLILDKRQGLHFEPGFQLGQVGVGIDFAYHVGPPATWLSSNGAQLQFQDDPHTADWFVRNVSGRLQIRAPQSNSLDLQNPLQLQGHSTMQSGSGVPGASVGSNGDYYFRDDGTAGAHIYFKANGSWTALI